MNGRATAEIASVAARLVVEEGLEYGPAKRKAARMLGRGAARYGPTTAAAANAATARRCSG